MTRLLLPLFSLTALLALPGCLPSKDTDPDQEDDTGDSDLDGDADTDADSDTDTDADSDTDTDSDTDADTDSDTDTDVEEDRDGDGFTVSEGDCNDRDDAINPRAPEICDEIDNDCNDEVDDDPVDGEEYPADRDGDGFGDGSTTVVSCDAVVTNTFDCDDRDASEPVVVDQYNAGSSQDGTSANPYETIQQGIDDADLCVAVYPGNYTELVDFDGKDIEVFSTGGAKNTIIDGGGAGSTVTFSSGESAAAELRGFTITAGRGTAETTTSSAACDSSSTCVTTYSRYYGGGIFVDGAAPTLRALMITGNTLAAYSYTEVSATEDYYVYSYGGGLFVNNSRGMELIDVSFAVNYADQGGAVYIGDTATVGITQSRLGYNSASNGGAITVAGGNLTLTNAVLVGNAATSGGGAAYADDGVLTWWNVTSASNAGASGSGVAVMGTADFFFQSSSISYGVGGAGVFLESSAASLDADYSDAYDNGGGNYGGVTAPTGSNGNLEFDPGFTSFTDDGVENDDFTLDSGSALINAGNPSASYNDVDGTRNDIGAYGGPEGGW